VGAFAAILRRAHLAAAAHQLGLGDITKLLDLGQQVSSVQYRCLNSVQFRLANVGAIVIADWSVVEVLASACSCTIDPDSMGRGPQFFSDYQQFLKQDSCGWGAAPLRATAH